jgi:tripartite-type tricarboxylate transporter receptor subunit TctC
MTINRRTFVAAAIAAVAASPVYAQNYPTRPIRLIVPYPPGGGTDFFARIVATDMGNSLGQAIVVENRPGAGTLIGAEAVARAKPDGYTFLLGDTSTYASNRSLYTKLPYDADKDFAPISLTGRFAIVLLVNTDKLKVTSVKELIDAAKKDPGKIDYGSAGIGSPFHLAGELFAQASGVKLNHIPYKGAAPAIQDLVSGQIGMMFIDYATARGQLAMKQIKAIAVASPGEFSGLPGVPPVAAYVQGFEAWAWQGFVAPAATPKDVIDKLNAAYLKAVGNTEIKQKLIGAGIDPLQSTPAQMADYMKSEAAKWEKVIKTANIKLD